MTGRLSGRSGRQRLAHQLQTAHRGSDLLERKRRILAGELERLRLLTEQTARTWAESAEDAIRWSARSLALDGAARIAASAPQRPATVEVRWQTAMGVSYPGSVQVLLPEPQPTSGSSSLVLAAQAQRRSLHAAAEHGAAVRAFQLVRAELESTRDRQRAIDRRWIPRLVERLRRLEAQLDELEREENVRLRWVAGPEPDREQR